MVVKEEEKENKKDVRAVHEKERGRVCAQKKGKGRIVRNRPEHAASATPRTRSRRTRARSEERDPATGIAPQVRRPKSKHPT